MVYSLADLPRLVDDLLFLTSDDERILSTASELQELLGGRLENNRLRGAIADNLSDGASSYRRSRISRPACAVLSTMPRSGSS
jgi:hypothetical protein